MIGAISGAYTYNSAYASYFAAGTARGADAAQMVRGSAAPSGVWASRKASTPETPVEPVRPVPPVNGQEEPPVKLGPTIREGADPAEMAVRMRIKPYEEGNAQPMEGKEADGPDNGAKAGAEGAQAAIEEGKCQTCEKRKYQDESDDMGVSFQTPTNISPEQVASAVRGHENEHVVREQAKAEREDRKVVSQSVTLHTDICPECGKVYISGGTTRTVTAAEQTPEAEVRQEAEDEAEGKGLSLFA